MEESELCIKIVAAGEDFEDGLGEAGASGEVASVRVQQVRETSESSAEADLFDQQFSIDRVVDHAF